MSKVKIQGNASGTGIFTVAAPATNTDRTLTLPDTSSTLLAPDSTGSIQLDYAGSNNYLNFISPSNYVGRNASTGDIWLNAQGGQGVVLGVGGTSQLKVDGNGRMTLPNQPKFYAYTNNTTMNSGNKVLFDQAPINTGNYFNTSTNTFTAPIAGTYYFSAVVRYNQVGTTYSQTQIYVNGSITFQGHYSNTTNAASTYSGVPAVTVVSLAAGDTVNVYAVISGGGSFTYSGSESCFFGWLMG